MPDLNESQNRSKTGTSFVCVWGGGSICSPPGTDSDWTSNKKPDSHNFIPNPVAKINCYNMVYYANTFPENAKIVALVSIFLEIWFLCIWNWISLKFVAPEIFYSYHVLWLFDSFNYSCCHWKKPAESHRDTHEHTYLWRWLSWLLSVATTIVLI